MENARSFCQIVVWQFFGRENLVKLRVHLKATYSHIIEGFHCDTGGAHDSDYGGYVEPSLHGGISPLGLFGEQLL